jgi:hypothetical protein
VRRILSIVAIQDQTAQLRRVLVRPPEQANLAAWAEYGWRSEPDWSRSADEHAAFRELLAAAGADVLTGTTPVPGDPDEIYAYDPVLLTDSGAILLRPGKPGRRNEPEAAGQDLVASGVPITGWLKEPATAEGGDMFWLDPTTLLVGRSYRTNEDGIAQLREQVEPMGARLIDFDLPVQQAIEAPRFVLDAKPNFYKPGAEITVQIENRAPAETIDALKAIGHKVTVLPGWGSLGHMQAIRIDPKTGTMMAGGDPRRTAYAMGY